MKRFIDRCVWGVVVAVENLMGLLPVPAVWRLGAWLGGIAHALLPGYRALARANHRIAFGYASHSFSKTRAASFSGVSSWCTGTIS